MSTKSRIDNLSPTPQSQTCADSKDYSAQMRSWGPVIIGGVLVGVVAYVFFWYSDFSMIKKRDSHGTILPDSDPWRCAVAAMIVAAIVMVAIYLSRYSY